MRKMILIAAGFASLLPTMPAIGQSYYDQQDNGYYNRGDDRDDTYDRSDSYDNARDRYEADRQRYEAERDAYYRNRNDYNSYSYDNRDAYSRRGYYDRYGTWHDYANNGYDNRYAYNGQSWRGRDGRYYCRRSDGTTGLLIGGVAGALVGNAIDGGRNRAAGTIIGGGAGALLGREVDRDSQSYCR